MVNVGTLGLFAASLHCIQALIVFSLIGTLESTEGRDRVHSGIFDITRTVSVWENRSQFPGEPLSMIGNFSVVVENVPTGVLDARYAIAFFFMLSALFQGGGASFVIESSPMPHTVQRHRGITLMARVRLLEYSISASLMIMAIMIEIGLTNAYVLSASFLLCMLCMLLGMIAEIFSMLSDRLRIAVFKMDEPCLQLFGDWLWTFPHALGWICMAGVWVPIFDSFLQSQARSSRSAPDFVKVIVASESFLFMCFGIVQTVSLTRRTLASKDIGSADEKLLSIDESAERWYIILSFTAKTLLGWLIISPMIV